MNAPIAVHPRLRARRIAVRRAEGRRRFHRLVALACVLGALVLGALLVQSPLLDVDHVTVAGAEQTAVDAVVAATGVAGGEAMATLDLGAIERRLEALPWVASAELARKWPGTIRITVAERAPVAVVADAQRAWLVDRSGRVLASAPDAADLVTVRIPGVVRVEPGGTLDGLDAALAVAARVPLEVPGEAAGIRVADGEVSVELATGGTVLLGDAAELDDKLVALRTVLDQVDRTCLDVLDLRVPTHPALRREDPCR